METQQGEESNNQGQRENENENESFSELTLQTISKIKKNHHRRTEAFTKYRDQKSPGFEWLLPGWVAEERHMKSGRVYKYFYDPSGQLYRSKSEVKAAWDEIGLIVID